MRISDWSSDVCSSDLVLFLVAAVVSRLAASLLQQGRRADAYAARNATIAGFARRLLSCASEADIADVTVAELARLFSVYAVLLMSRYARHLAAAAPAGITLAPSDLAAAASTLATGEPTGRGVRKVDLADW